MEGNLVEACGAAVDDGLKISPVPLLHTIPKGSPLSRHT